MLVDVADPNTVSVPVFPEGRVHLINLEFFKIYSERRAEIYLDPWIPTKSKSLKYFY